MTGKAITRTSRSFIAEGLGLLVTNTSSYSLLKSVSTRGEETVVDLLYPLHPDLRNLSASSKDTRPYRYDNLSVRHAHGC